MGEFTDQVINAFNVTLEDILSQYTAEEVEGALAEVMAKVILEDLWDRTGTDVYFHNAGDDLWIKDSEKILLGTGKDGELYSDTDDIYLKNITQDKDIIIGIDDGGVVKTITWDADVDKLKHSAGLFDFDDDDIITTGTLALGDNSVVDANRFITIQDDTHNSDGNLYGIKSVIVKTEDDGGTYDNYGIYNEIEIDDTGATHKDVVGIYSYLSLMNGTNLGSYCLMGGYIGSDVNDNWGHNIYGLELECTVNADVGGTFVGLHSKFELPSGTLTDDFIGTKNIHELSGGHANSDFYGIYEKAYIKDLADIDGTAYGIYLDDTNLDYGLYQNGTAPSKLGGDLEIAGEMTIKVYSQDGEPTLDTDSKFCFWIDTNDSNKTWILFRRGSGDQIKVELT